MATVTIQWKELDTLLREVRAMQEQMNNISTMLARHDSLPKASTTPQEQSIDGHRFIRLAEVRKRVGFSNSSIYAMMNEGTFPKPYHHGRSSLWLESDVIKWQNNIINSSGNT